MQVRLKSVLALVAIASFLFFLATTSFIGPAFLISLTVALISPIFLLGMIVYGKEYGRAFAVGAMFPMILLVLFSTFTLLDFSMRPIEVIRTGLLTPIDMGMASIDPTSDPYAAAYTNIDFFKESHVTPMISRTWLFSILALLGGMITCVTKWICELINQANTSTQS